MKLPELPLKEPLIYNEKRTIRRLTFKGWLLNVLEAFDLEKGGIYTLKLFFTNPGKLVRKYLGSERYKVVAPFKFS